MMGLQHRRREYQLLTSLYLNIISNLEQWFKVQKSLKIASYKRMSTAPPRQKIDLRCIPVKDVTFLIQHASIKQYTSCSILSMLNTTWSLKRHSEREANVQQKLSNIISETCLISQVSANILRFN